jgi:hypothetical protein
LDKAENDDLIESVPAQPQIIATNRSRLYTPLQFVAAAVSTTRSEPCICSGLGKAASVSHDEGSAMEHVLTFKRIIPIIAFFGYKSGKRRIAGLLFLVTLSTV